MIIIFFLPYFLLFLSFLVTSIIFPSLKNQSIIRFLTCFDVLTSTYVNISLSFTALFSAGQERKNDCEILQQQNDVFLVRSGSYDGKSLVLCMFHYLVPNNKIVWHCQLFTLAAFLKIKRKWLFIQIVKRNHLLAYFFVLLKFGLKEQEFSLLSKLLLRLFSSYKLLLVFFRIGSYWV